MAKNREPVKSVENESESTEEEESGDSSDEVESDPETGLALNKDTKNPPFPSLKNSQPSQPLPPDSSDEEDSESDSESDPEPSKLAGKQQTPKPSTTKALTPAKRPAEGKKSEDKDGKKLKKKSEPVPEKKVAESRDVKKPNKNTDSVSEISTGDSSKKVPFQRVWSEDAEIVILKGMIEYEAKNNSSPSADLDAFLDYIKKNLHVDVSKTQLQDKIRRLKKKYENNKNKDLNFTKPHEKSAYELSEKIWGNEKGKETATLTTKANGSAIKRSPTKKSNAVENGEHKAAMEVSNGAPEKKLLVGKRGEHEAAMEVSNGAPEKKLLVGKSVSSYALTTEEKILRIGAELFEGEDEIEGSSEWKKLEREDMELSLKKMDVMRAKMRLVLDNLK